MLLAFLQLKPEGFEPVAASIWGSFALYLGSWIASGDQSAERVLLGTSHVADLARLYLLYSEACSRQPDSWHEHKGKKLANILPQVGRGLCIFLDKLRPASIASSHWEALFACPGLIDAALTQLVALAQYLHKQHAARQLSSSAADASAGRGMGGNGKSSSSCSQKQHSKASSKKSTSSSSTQRPCVIGASSFSQLLLQPHHEMVAVAGGTRAIIALVVRLEQIFGTTLLNSSGLSCSRDRILDEFRVPAMILEKTLFRLSVTTAPLHTPTTAQKSAAAAAAAEEPMTVGGAAQGERDLLGEAEAYGALSGVALLPVLHLLLELSVLLCSKEELSSLGRHAAGFVMAGPQHREEELQPFYTASAPLLLQVVWLIAQEELSKGQGPESRHELFELFLSGAIRAGAALNIGWQSWETHLTRIRFGLSFSTLSASAQFVLFG